MESQGVRGEGLEQCFPNFFESQTVNDGNFFLLIINFFGGPFFVSFVQQKAIFRQILHVLNPKKNSTDHFKNFGGP